MPNNRKDPNSDSQFVEIIDEITRRVGITENGLFSRPVIEEYIPAFYERRLTEIASLNKRKPTPSDIEASRRHCASFTAKRWFDTGHRLRGASIIFATQGEELHRSAFTLWLDPALVEQARTTGVPLSQIVRQRLYDRLKRLVGTKAFGFWFHIERTREDPYDIHIHGIITLKDRSYFQNETKRDKLRKEIKAAGGREFKRDGSRTLHMKSANLNIGWINYCRKQRPMRRLKPIVHRKLPDDIGLPLDAWAGTLKQDTTRFYANARFVYNAIISGDLKNWDETTWEQYCLPELVSL